MSALAVEDLPADSTDGPGQFVAREAVETPRGDLLFSDAVVLQALDGRQALQERALCSDRACIMVFVLHSHALHEL